MCKCELCLQEKQLKRSHLISKLFFNFMKKNSPTGGIRDINIPNRRIQDGQKVPLLCHECEEKLSKYETFFSKNYYNSLSFDKGVIDTNNDHLRYFVLSLHWRSLLWNSIQDDVLMNSMSEKEKEVFFKVLEKWRSSLYSENYEILRSIKMKIIPTHNLEGIYGLKNFFTKNVLFDFRFQSETDSFKFAISYIQVPNFIFICEVWGDFPKMKQFTIGKRISFPKRVSFPDELKFIFDRNINEALKSIDKITPKQRELLLNKAKESHK